MTDEIGITVRERIEAECARRGKEAVVADCLALLRGGTDQELLQSLTGPAARKKFFDGKEHHDLYWFRAWALRGLLWAWDDSATDHVRAALTDQSWRVREMAAKVVARHGVGDALAAVAGLRDDPVPRVRAAAERAVVRVTQSSA